MTECETCERYRQVLAEYIATVGACEGVDFTRELLDSSTYPEEKKALLRDALALSEQVAELDS
jgi:hypothetical protein